MDKLSHDGTGGTVTRWNRSLMRQEGRGVQTRKRRRKMAFTDKHIRIRDEALQMIQNRDKNRFPLERDFVNEAILSFGDRQCLENILKELQELRSYVEKTFENGGYR